MEQLQSTRVSSLPEQREGAASHAALIANLERALNPRTVAVIGDHPGRRYMWLRAMREFKGKLYSVQLNGDQSQQIAGLGVPSYRSILQIPEGIDYAVCSVPRKAAPAVLAECVKANVGGVGMFTSGFAETGEEEGIRLQGEIGRIARAGNLAVVGPNCMGVYNPSLGVRQTSEQLIGEGGRVGMISQSGTHSVAFSMISSLARPNVSKAVSIGNAVVLDIPDYLEYMTGDPATQIIALYAEGIRDGRRFFEALRAAARVKPVIAWKGGVGEAGARAIASHTASLATSSEIWPAVLRQCGAIQVNNMEEMLDTVKAFLYMKTTTGSGVGLMAMTGGQSVVIADAFARAGLDAPLLTDESYAELSTFFNTIGGSYKNPLDMGGTLGFGGDPNTLNRLLDIFERDRNVDAIVMETAIWFVQRYVSALPDIVDRFIAILAEHKNRSKKPFALVVEELRGEVTREIRRKIEAAGLASFPSFERAANALRRFIDYNRFQAGLE